MYKRQSQNLTEIEKVLLAEFEALGSAFEALAQEQSRLSEHFSVELSALTHRQNQLEQHLQQVSTALERSNASMSALIERSRKLTNTWP